MPTMVVTIQSKFCQCVSYNNITLQKVKINTIDRNAL